MILVGVSAAMILFLLLPAPLINQTAPIASLPGYLGDDTTFTQPLAICAGGSKLNNGNAPLVLPTQLEIITDLCRVLLTSIWQNVSEF